MIQSNKELPQPLKKLPDVAQSLFRESFNRSVERGNGEHTSAKIAWKILKKRFVQKGDTWVARSDAFVTTTYYTFNAQLDEALVSKSENGNIIHTYVLTDTQPDSTGVAPTEELLQEWADSVNGLEIDTDHELFNIATKQYKGNAELVAKATRHKKGIAKIIDTVVKSGKLFVKVMFDKRYTKFVSKIKGLSLEAAVRFDEMRKKMVSGTLFGATFSVNSTPVNPRAVRYA